MPDFRVLQIINDRSVNCSELNSCRSVIFLCVLEGVIIIFFIHIQYLLDPPPDTKKDYEQILRPLLWIIIVKAKNLFIIFKLLCVLHISVNRTSRRATLSLIDSARSSRMLALLLFARIPFWSDPIHSLGAARRSLVLVWSQS